MIIENLNISDNLVKVNRVISDVEYNIYTIKLDGSFDVKDIVGIKKLKDIVYIDGNYYEIVSMKCLKSELILVCKKLIGVCKIVSENILITNDFVGASEQQPAIMVPVGTKVIYEGVEPIKEGLVEIYKTDSITLVEPIVVSNIKIYDDMGSSDDTEWKLVLNPEEYEFTGQWVIEHGNVRLRGRDVYLYINGAWTDSKVGYLYAVLNGGENINMGSGKISLSGNTIEVKYLDSNNVWNDMKIVLDNGVIYTVGNQTISKIVPSESNLSVDGYIYVNSDNVVRTSGHETDYTLSSGSKGWILRIGKSVGEVCVLFSDNANLSYSDSSGNIDVDGKWKHYYLVNYVGKLFIEAESGVINGGTSVEDADASGGYVVQGDGSTLNVEIINTQTKPEFKLPAGDYVVIYRLKASSTSANDTINLVVKNLTTGTDIVTVTKTAADIGTEYSYQLLSVSGYNGTDDCSIVVSPGANTDGTLFSVDYVVIVPISEIGDLQKRVFVSNNQKLVVE